MQIRAATVLPWVQAVAGVFTAVGVFLAWWHIRLWQKQARTDFEDSLAREYRDVAQQIPVKALLGEPLEAAEFADAFDELYRYVDLSNEQVFLRMSGRISRDTWENWVQGIRSNLERPAFRKAWTEIKAKTAGSFEELQRLERSDFRDDPRKW